VSAQKTRMIYLIISRVLFSFLLLTALLQFSVMPASAAVQINIPGPTGSGEFGITVTALPNGNIVVTDPYYNGGIGVDAGAVYLYDGATGTQISALTGGSAGDMVGSGGVTVLSNGNYVVCSPYWHNGSLHNAGAVTWGSATNGVSGVISPSNSLLGSQADDSIGSYGVTALSNGNYVVANQDWDNGGAVNAGAVTWGDGTTGVSDYISLSNSLIGSQNGDYVGKGGVLELTNGNYVVQSHYWRNVSLAYAGALTWGDGTAGVNGTIDSSNSLIGSKADDQVGYYVLALSNGNYVARTPYWNDGALADVGAVTWGDGTIGVSGVISSSNSLIGGQPNDQVGDWGVTELSNGNYVVVSPNWDNAISNNTGAVTWGSGTSGVSGVVDGGNSLVGNHPNDMVGSLGVTALTNGHYVVSSPNWDNGTISNAGAVTWGNGVIGKNGVVSAGNSLVGSTASDSVGYGGVTALSNGNYVVSSPYWDLGTVVDAGAVTWGNGIGGVSGAIDASNSLVGSQTSDKVGLGGVTSLGNGNYVVESTQWDSGSTEDVGAVTWGDGTTGVNGAITSSNSLVGSQDDDSVGGSGVTVLSNGNYVVRSTHWDSGSTENVGAVTWGDGTNGTSGVVSSSNSLVGSHNNDLVGYSTVKALANGNYVVVSHHYNGSVDEAGAVTWGDGTSGTSGVVSSSNSLVGNQEDDLVGIGGVTALTNGNYVVSSRYWKNGSADDAGAVTWGDGTIGVSGEISSTNSLVGSQGYDILGSPGITALSNGNYVVNSMYWDNGGTTDSGAITWDFGTSGISGTINGTNSVLGTAVSGGANMVFDYDEANKQLVVGRPSDNIVTLFRLPYLYLPIVKQ